MKRNSGPADAFGTLVHFLENSLSLNIQIHEASRRFQADYLRDAQRTPLEITREVEGRMS